MRGHTWPICGPTRGRLSSVSSCPRARHRLSRAPSGASPPSPSIDLAPCSSIRPHPPAAPNCTRTRHTDMAVAPSTERASRRRCKRVLAGCAARLMRMHYGVGRSLHRSIWSVRDTFSSVTIPRLDIADCSCSPAETLSSRSRVTSLSTSATCPGNPRKTRCHSHVKPSSLGACRGLIGAHWGSLGLVGAR